MANFHDLANKLSPMGDGMYIERSFMLAELLQELR